MPKSKGFEGGAKFYCFNVSESLIIEQTLNYFLYNI